MACWKTKQRKNLLEIYVINENSEKTNWLELVNQTGKKKQQKLLLHKANTWSMAET